MIQRKLFAIILAGIITAASQVGAAANDAKVKRVLYINSYDRGYSWSDDIERGLVERIKSADREIEMSVEYLDGRRFPETARYDLLAATLAAKYAGYRHDVVVVSDNFAFDFAIQYRQRLFPDLPIVFCGYNNFRPNVLKGIDNITGVNEEVDFAKTVQLAIRVQPAVRTLAFITSTGDASNQRMTEVAEATLFPELRQRYHLIVLKNASMAEIGARLGALPPDSAVFLIGMTSDLVEGRRPTPVENGRLISAVSPVPVYSFWDFQLGTCILGGHIITGLDQGRTAADMALRILGGTPADAMPVMMRTPARNIFDFSVMKKYGIKLNALPEGCSVINRPVSPGEGYGWYIGGAVLAISLEALLIIALVLSLRQRKEALRMLGVERDLLEQRVEERTGELKHSLSLLGASLESTVDGILIEDGQGKIARWNQKFAGMWKMPEDLLSSLDVETAKRHMLAQLVDPKEFEAKVRELREHPEQTSFEQIELTYGRVFERYSQPQRIEGTIVGRVWSFRDITERKRAEEALQQAHDELEHRVVMRTKELLRANEALRESEEKYRLIADNSNDWIYMINPDGKFQYVSPSSERMTGYPSGEFMNNPQLFLNITHPDDKEQVKSHQETAQKEAKTGNLEFRIVTKEGEIRWIMHSCLPVYNDQGEYVGRSATNRDFTERKHAEDTLRLLSSRLLTSQEDEQRRIAMELHDQTGQDIIFLKLQLQALKKRLRTDQNNLIKECDKILTFTDGIIEDVRCIAHGLSPSQLQTLGLCAALKALIQTFSEKTLIPIGFDLEALDNGFRPETQIVLYRIFQEALTNIYKHARAKTVRIDVRRQGNHLSISIRDDGQGFDPCRYRTSEPTVERGMGLSALELRSRMIGADLKISSQPGHGTDINLFVPLKGNSVA